MDFLQHYGCKMVSRSFRQRVMLQNKMSHLLFYNIYQLFCQSETLKHSAVSFNGFVPHGCRPNPQAAVPVKLPVHYHRLQTFRMGRNSNNFILLAFKMSVFSGLDVIIHSYFSFLLKTNIKIIAETAISIG